MKVVNFGSLNLDHLYHVPHAVAVGETLSARSYRISVGGKGLNQSIAAARAGISVFHAGLVGREGGMLVDCLRESGVDVSLVQATDAPQGHAVIQVNDDGNNCIIVFGGSNRQVSEAYIDQVLEGMGKGDCVIAQNEVSNVGHILMKAHELGCTVVFNASPIDDEILRLDYGAVDWLVVNELEGAAIAGCRKIEDIIPALAQKYPRLHIILTLGESGSLCYSEGQVWKQPAFPAQVVDTTGAGDTFLGYCTAGLLRGDSIPAMLRTAAAASSLAVSSLGAAASIPDRKQVEEYLARH